VSVSVTVLSADVVIETLVAGMITDHNSTTGWVSTAFFKKTFYEGWNFNSGNYLFTTDTK